MSNCNDCGAHTRFFFEKRFPATDVVLCRGCYYNYRHCDFCGSSSGKGNKRRQMGENYFCSKCYEKATTVGSCAEQIQENEKALQQVLRSLKEYREKYKETEEIEKTPVPAGLILDHVVSSKYSLPSDCTSLINIHDVRYYIDEAIEKIEVGVRKYQAGLKEIEEVKRYINDGCPVIKKQKK